MTRLFGRLNNLSYRGGETGTANVVIDDGVITVDVKGSPQDVTGACIIGNKVHIKRANASPLEMVLPLPQPDLAETNTESLAFVKNKKISYLENDKDYITTRGVGEGLSVGVDATVSVDTSKIATNKYVDSKTAVVTENITQHKNDYNNPHKVTKAQVELDKVNNTSDMDKPVSKLQQQALDKKVDKVEGKGLSTEDFTTELKGKLDGIENGAQVNTITGVKGDAESEYRVGNVNITKENIGLGNVDNTSDIEKPVSTLQREALDKKVDKVEGKGLSTNDYDDTAVAEVAKIKDKADTATVTALVEQVATKTNVTVNGEHVDEFDADTKVGVLENNSNNYVVYARGPKSNGATHQLISTVATTSLIDNGSIAKYARDDSANDNEPKNHAYLVSDTPVRNYHVATKKYVDDIANTKLDKDSISDYTDDEIQAIWDEVMI